jgi:hypothetical protein
LESGQVFWPIQAITYGEVGSLPLDDALSTPPHFQYYFVRIIAQFPRELLGAEELAPYKKTPPRRLPGGVHEKDLSIQRLTSS